MEQRMEADPARDDELILVDGLDRQVGTASKLRAHAEGLLHRAFSVVLVREDGDGGGGGDGGGPQLLLAQRAQGKYHSGGLWTNSCCSHPRAGETLPQAAYRRVREELGCEACDLREVGAFAYRAVFDNGLVEHEFDHVLVGGIVGTPNPDPTEAAALRWVGFDGLARELTERPGAFTAWAPMVLSMTMIRLSQDCG